MPTPFDQLPVLTSDRAQLIDRKTSWSVRTIQREIFGPDPVAIRPILFCTSPVEFPPCSAWFESARFGSPICINRNVRSPHFCLCFASHLRRKHLNTSDQK